MAQMTATRSAASLRGSVCSPDDSFPCARLVVGALAFYFVALAARVVIAGLHEHAAVAYWTGSVLAFALFAAAGVLVVRQMSVEIEQRVALAVAALTLAGVAVTWITAVLDSGGELRDYIPLLSTRTVVVVLLILRNRLLLAWAVVGLDVVVGLVFGSLTRSDMWLSVVFPRAGFVVLFVATCTALLLGPHVAEMRGLSERRRADALGGHDEPHDGPDRDERIRRIDQRVRPLLDKVVAGDVITEDDVITARLKEARLRDGIRGRALDVTRVRTAVWAARRRGVSVTVLDDSGLAALDPADAADIVDATARVLEAELAGLADGDVVARIAPSGRDPIATVTVVSEDRRLRVELSTDGRVNRVEM